MKRISALLVLFLSLAPLTWAKTEKVRSTKLPNGLMVHEYKMDNGMQLLLVPDSSAPVFTYQMWFKVGSLHEKMDPKLQKTGLAHLFEHMMFRGTPRFPDGQFDRTLSAAGAEGMNATTALDRTNYFQSLPKEKLELAFDLESDRMRNLVINEKLFKTELGAVFGEAKMNLDKPGTAAYYAVMDLAYEKHPYKYKIIGEDAELNSFTVKDAMYFYKTYYAPNNATLILVGDFKIPQALQLAEKYYGNMKAQVVPHHEPPMEPEQTKAKKREITHPLARADILTKVFKIPNAAHADIAALEVTGAILGVGQGSILEQELVQAGLASSVSVGPYRLRYPGVFFLEATLAEGKSSSTVMSIMEDALERVKKGEISEGEVLRAKNQYLLSAYNELLDAATIGRNLGGGLVTTDNYLREFQILEQIEKVTLAEVQKVANAYLKEERSSLVHLTPAKK